MVFCNRLARCCILAVVGAIYLGHRDQRHTARYTRAAVIAV